MQQIHKHKKSFGVIVLGGIFFGAALLPILYLILKMYIFLSWQYFLLAILPHIIIYLILGLFVFNKWNRIPIWQKVVLITVGSQYVILFSLQIISLYFWNQSLSPIAHRFLFEHNFILSPLEYIYQKLVINARDNSGAYHYRITYHWETGLILPLLGIIRKIRAYLNGHNYFFWCLFWSIERTNLRFKSIFSPRWI